MPRCSRPVDLSGPVCPRKDQLVGGCAAEAGGGIPVLCVDGESASARLATGKLFERKCLGVAGSRALSRGHNRAPQMITPPVDICLMDLIISQFPPQIDFMPGRRALCDLARKLSRAGEANGHLEKSIDVKFPLLERKGL